MRKGRLRDRRDPLLPGEIEAAKERAEAHMAERFTPTWGTIHGYMLGLHGPGYMLEKKTVVNSYFRAFEGGRQ